METTTAKAITVETTVNAPVEKVWKLWNGPEHIIQWNNASDDWHNPKSENDVRVGGKFKHTMAAKDGSVSFDFEGTYTTVREHERLEYTIADGRKVQVTFTAEGNSTKVVETFEMENENSEELQRGGWQAILGSFKKYAEAWSGVMGLESWAINS
ncbi:MAG: SRPBCC family protein [Flavobacteriales bacterium]|nr:SRPBCC family protein [Flavobacteriales bacterium]